MPSLSLREQDGKNCGTTGRGLQLIEPNSHGGELDESEEVGAELVVSRGDAPELLQLVEEALDVIALAIDRLLPAKLGLPVGAVGNVGDRAVIADAGTDTIGVVALVGNDDGTMLDAFEQRLGMRHVVIVAGRDQELDRAALRIDARVDFRREAAAASPHTTISTFFSTPEAC